MGTVIANPLSSYLCGLNPVGGHTPEKPYTPEVFYGWPVGQLCFTNPFCQASAREQH